MIIYLKSKTTELWTLQKPETTGPFLKVLSTLFPMSSLLSSLVVNSTEVSLRLSLPYRFHCPYQGIVPHA